MITAPPLAKKATGSVAGLLEGGPAAVVAAARGSGELLAVGAEVLHDAAVFFPDPGFEFAASFMEDEDASAGREEERQRAGQQCRRTSGVGRLFPQGRPPQ